MRQYSYQATEETVEALRLLRSPWMGLQIDRYALTVRLEDGRAVRIAVEEAKVEADFEAARLRADVLGEAPVGDAGPGDFAEGGNDVVLLSGATWVGGEAAPVDDGNGATPGGGGGGVLFSGSLLQIDESATAVCVTTDAVVVATAAGSGLLVRTGVKPGTVDVIDDAAEIARFLRSRGYRED